MTFTQGHALIIGVGEYDYLPGNSVPVVVRDAQAVADVLRNPLFCGYPDSQVVCLNDPQASAQGTLDALDQLAKRVKPDDTVFIYYAGHGTIGADGNYYLVSYDARVSAGGDVADGCVSQQQLIDKLRLISAARMVMLFNTCHSGKISPSLGLGPALESRNLPDSTVNALLGTGTGRIIITACRQKQKSYFGDGKLTYFTQALVDGLSGKGPRPPGNTISAFGLYLYVYETVCARVAQQGLVQEPEITVLNGVGSFALSLYQGAPDADPGLAEHPIEPAADSAVRIVMQALDSFAEGLAPRRLTAAERQKLGRDYAGEVAVEYESFQTDYTALSAVAPVRPQDSARTAQMTATHKFEPRGFAVLKQLNFSPAETGGEGSPPQPEHFDDLRKAIAKYGSLILLGEPGAGKTTTLDRLMLDYSLRAQAEASAPLPILVSLGRYDGTGPLVDFIRSELRLAARNAEAGKMLEAHQRLAAHLEEYLADGQLALFFDALNEMPRDGYGNSVRRLEVFRQAYRANSFIFTCRALDYTVRLDVKEVTIEDLNETAQRNFLRARFGDEDGKIFMTLRPHSDLLELGRNPYFLTMIGQIVQQQGQLPANRGLLFQAFVVVLMERERETHPERWLDAEVQVRVLSDVGLAIQREPGLGTSVPRAWLNQYLTGHVAIGDREAEYQPADLLYLARSASLLDQMPDGSVRFRHQLLQEYFAAVSLRRLGVDSGEMREAVRSYAWDEVLVLLAGLLDDPTAFLLLLATVDPYLSAQAASSARSLSDAARAGLLKRLSEKQQSKFESERTAAAQALVKLAPPIAAPQSHAALKAVAPQTDSERQIHGQTRTIYEQIAADAKKSALERWSILQDEQTKIFESTASNQIAQAVQADEVKKRANELRARLASPELIVLLKDKDKIDRLAAEKLLGELNPDEVIPQLLPCLRDPTTWFLVKRVLRAYGAAVVIPQLVPLCADPAVNVREAAARVLDSLASAQSLPILLGLLKDTDLRVRYRAMRALGSFRSVEAVPQLIPLLDDNAPVPPSELMDESHYEKWDSVFYGNTVRALALRALEATVQEQHIPLLVPLLSDSRPSVYNAAFDIIDAARRRLNLPKDYAPPG